MKILAVLDVDEGKIAKTGRSFKEEMGRLAQSGITLSSYTDADKCRAYVYAAFAWNMEKKEYAQIGRAVITEQLCRNRFAECVKSGLLESFYDAGNVIFKRRSISELYGDWEDLE